MNKHIKKITAAVLAAAFSAGVWSVPVYAHDVTAYTGGITVNAYRDGECVGPSWSTEEATGEEAEEMLEFFGLDSTTQAFWYLSEDDEVKYSPIPEGYPTSFKIENAAEAEEIYLRGTAEYDLTVHPDGTVTCSNDFSSDTVENHHTIEIYYNGKYITINVVMKNYAADWIENYCNQVVDDFIAENITDDMTDYEKMLTSLYWLAEFPYQPCGGTSYGVLSGAGAGDCWIYTDLVYRVCSRLGIPCKRRLANKDLMASSTHRNCAVLLDGSSYIVDVGTSVRNIVVYKLPTTDRISTQYKTYENYLYIEHADGIEIYQYLGFEKNVVVPETINGKPVVKTGTGSFFSKDAVIETLILPDAAADGTEIHYYTPDTTVVTYSGTVLQEGYYEIPELPITTTTTAVTTTTTTTTSETTITTANTTDTTDSDMTTTSGISDTTGSDTTTETTATETTTTETITSDTSETTETTTETSTETSTETVTETVSSETEVSTDPETSVETVTSETTTTEATEELPQTGYPNSFKLVIPSAFAVTALGAFAMVKSGRLRRKEDEE